MAEICSIPVTKTKTGKAYEWENYFIIRWRSSSVFLYFKILPWSLFACSPQWGEPRPHFCCFTQERLGQFPVKHYNGQIIKNINWVHYDLWNLIMNIDSKRRKDTKQVRGAPWMWSYVYLIPGWRNKFSCPKPAVFIISQRNQTSFGIS